MGELLRDVESPQVKEQLVGNEDQEEILEISLNVVQGQYHLSTLQMQGTCKEHPIMVLIDRRSTYNFIKSTIVSKLSLPIMHVSAFQVSVGNGALIECMTKCVRLPLVIQGHVFTVNSYVRDLNGADIVFGVQWMMGLAIIRTNYWYFTMAFKWKGEQVTLQGERLLKLGVYKQ